MKGLNICNWTRVGEAALCGKSCCGTYCKNHLFKIRKGSKIPAPCRSCGRGVQSDIQLCRACGREKFRQRHISLEKRARDQFLLVLADLAVRNLHLESGIAGCIPFHLESGIAGCIPFHLESGIAGCIPSQQHDHNGRHVGGLQLG